MVRLKPVQQSAIEGMAKQLICSLCRKTLENPRTTDCKHHFCLECIEDWLGDSSSCPRCKLPQFPMNLKKNPALSSIIESFKELRDCLRLAEEHQEVLEQQNSKKMENERISGTSTSSPSEESLVALSSLAIVAAAAEPVHTSSANVPDLIGSMIGQMIGEETEETDSAMAMKMNTLLGGPGQEAGSSTRDTLPGRSSVRLESDVSASSAYPTVVGGGVGQSADTMHVLASADGGDAASDEAIMRDQQEQMILNRGNDRSGVDCDVVPATLSQGSIHDDDGDDIALPIRTDINADMDVWNTNSPGSLLRPEKSTNLLGQHTSETKTFAQHKNEEEKQKQLVKNASSLAPSSLSCDSAGANTQQINEWQRALEARKSARNIDDEDQEQQQTMKNMPSNWTSTSVPLSVLPSTTTARRSPFDEDIAPPEKHTDVGKSAATTTTSGAIMDAFPSPFSPSPPHPPRQVPSTGEKTEPAPQQQLPQQDPASVRLMGSGLSSTHRHNLAKLAQDFDGCVLSRFKLNFPPPTHLVVQCQPRTTTTTDDKDIKNDHNKHHRTPLATTLKYVLALSNGCWIVGEDWLEACARLGRWAPEEEYEVDYDRHFGYYIPHNARVAKVNNQPAVLSDVRVYLGPWQTENEKTLIRSAHARYILRAAHAQMRDARQLIAMQLNGLSSATQTDDMNAMLFPPRTNALAKTEDQQQPQIEDQRWGQSENHLDSDQSAGMDVAIVCHEMVTDSKTGALRRLGHTSSDKSTDVSSHAKNEAEAKAWSAECDYCVNVVAPLCEATGCVVLEAHWLVECVSMGGLSNSSTQSKFFCRKPATTCDPGWGR